MAPGESPALPVAHVMLRILVVLNWLSGAAILALLLATIFAEQWTMTALGIPDDHEIRRLIMPLRVVAGLGIVAVFFSDAVFRRLLARETNAGLWRELTRVYRRLQARGEIRGGRFVAGMSGEQFALAEAVERLREIRRTPADGRLVTVAAADPLNLTGIVTAGERVRSAVHTRLVYRDGVPIAAIDGDSVRELTPIDDALAADLRRNRASGWASTPASAAAGLRSYRR